MSFFDTVKPENRVPTIGRPKKEFDWQQFDDLCWLQCTLQDLCFFFKVSEDTIERRVKEKHSVTFAEYYKHASMGGKISLRRAQFQCAVEKLNPKMLEILGYYYLDQKPVKQELSMEVKDDDKLAREYADQLKALGFQKAQEIQIAKEDDAKLGNPS